MFKYYQSRLIVIMLYETEDNNILKMSKPSTENHLHQLDYIIYLHVNFTYVNRKETNKPTGQCFMV